MPHVSWDSRAVRRTLRIIAAVALVLISLLAIGQAARRLPSTPDDTAVQYFIAVANGDAVRATVLAGKPVSPAELAIQRHDFLGSTETTRVAEAAIVHLKPDGVWQADPGFELYSIKYTTGAALHPHKDGYGVITRRSWFGWEIDGTYCELIY